MSEKNPFGELFRVWGWIFLIIFGIADLIICVSIFFEILEKLNISGIWEFLIFMVAIVFSPGLFVLLPWYPLIAYKVWWPLVVVYGGGIFTWFLFMISSIILKDYESNNL